MLAFLSPPSDGELWFRGRRVPGSGKAMDWQSARQVTLMLQHPYLFEGSVWANLEMALKARGIGRSERNTRIVDALKRLNLASLGDRPAKSLSAGERQRAALARAVCLKTPVLLLDEPSANVDEEHLPVIESLIHQLRHDGVTIVMATHDAGLARRLGADVWHMYNGGLLPRLERSDDAINLEKERGS